MPGQKIQLLGTGLNAHGQLSSPLTVRSPGEHDVLSLTPLTPPTLPKDLRFLIATWSTATFQSGSRHVTLGHPRATTSQGNLPDGANYEDLDSFFGDHNGPLGCLDREGRLWMFSEDHNAHDTTLYREDFSLDTVLLDHVALAGNGKVVVTIDQETADEDAEPDAADSGVTCDIMAFDDVWKFLAWYRDPAKHSGSYDFFYIDGKVKQVVAGTGTFLARTQSGECYSWGDARYESLGRSASDVPAARPGLVEGVAGLNIAKIVSGGWLSATLSEDGACYVWGAATAPGTEHSLRFLQEAGAGEVALVDLPHEDDEEALDVLDVAVGDNHIVVLAPGNRCFGVGENKYGQLGLGHDQPFIEDWTELALGGYRVRQLFAGPKSTFAIVDAVD